jgi:hypothetical protein
MQYYSKNYQKFLQNRSKKVDKFIVNCIGWTHVYRIIEVLGMTIRDLVYRIVPTKVVVRELRTTNGKVLRKDCKYTLVEKKRYVTVGKKTQVDYIYELDLKDESSDEEDRGKEEKESMKAGLFYLNFEDFSMFKLKSIMFFLFQTLTYTETIIALWI